MSQLRTLLSTPVVAAAYVIAVLTAASPARAAVISAEPTLPVLGVPYAPAIGAGCFPLAGVCVSGGSITPVSVVSSTFDASGQDIIANVVYSGMLTTLANVPIMPLTLTGTMAQVVLGRMTPTEIGSWATELTALSLSGLVLGNTLTVMLDSSSPSTGATSIVSIGNPNEPEFLIDSFFDVFLALRLDTIPPLITTRGPIRASLVAVPEPVSLALLGLGLAALAWSRRRNG